MMVGAAGFLVKSVHGYRRRLAGMMNGDLITMVIGADRERLLPGCGIPRGREQGLNYCVQTTNQAPAMRLWATAGRRRCSKAWCVILLPEPLSRPSARCTHPSPGKSRRIYSSRRTA